LLSKKSKLIWDGVVTVSTEFFPVHGSPWSPMVLPLGSVVGPAIVEPSAAAIRNEACAVWIPRS
jgi:hypothetical protein